MTAHTPNQLHDEFPQDAEAIQHLKQTNAHFAKLAEEHHDINRAIHRVETDIEPASDMHLEDLKKQRLALLDEIAAMLAAESAD